MSDREIDNFAEEVPSIPQNLERVLLFALDEAKQKMQQTGEVVPFTVLDVKDNYFIETHPADTVEKCFVLARQTVEGARGSNAYAFCYDGYIDTNDGTKDALIAEGGLSGDESGIAACYLYSRSGTDVVFENDPAYVGEAPNFMACLKEAAEYSDLEIDEKYIDGLL